MKDFTPRELATVLAALRYWQTGNGRTYSALADIATDDGAFKPLSAGEVDALCERLNSEEPAKLAPLAIIGELHAHLSDAAVDAFARSFLRIAKGRRWTWASGPITLHAIRTTVLSLACNVADAIHAKPAQGHWSASTGRVVLHVEVFHPRSAIVRLSCDIAA